MTTGELRELRNKIGFSMADIAICLKMPKSTYARYEDGTAAIPKDMEKSALELLRIGIEFVASAPGRIDARINKEFPHGFMSEAGE